MFYLCYYPHFLYLLSSLLSAVTQSDDKTSNKESEKSKTPPDSSGESGDGSDGVVTQSQLQSSTEAVLSSSAKETKPDAQVLVKFV